MQALYLIGQRQISALTTDLTTYATPEDDEASLTQERVDPAALNGQIVVSLQGLQRTIDDYENMSRNELVEEKRVKAQTRVQKFKEDYARLRQQFEKAKQTRATHVQQSASDRSNLLSTASTSSISSPSSSRQRYAQRPTSTLPPAESPFTLPSRPQAHGKRDSGAFTSRTNAALDESTFINSTHNMLDQYIAQGQAVLGNLHTQRDVLKGTQRRLLSVANTLGLSRSTITFIERRSKGDMAVLLAGAVGTFVCFYYILRYFG